MTKTGRTKKKIFDELKEGPKTPTELSEKLGKANSTISEQLKELESLGAISQVENPHYRREKRFRANPEFDISNITEIRRGSRIPQIAAATLVIALGLITLLTVVLPALSTSPASSPGGQLTFQLTDPPKVPTGTQALNITYSSLQVQFSSGGGSGYVTTVVNISGSGSVDLMSLINTSEVIGMGRMPANATIKEVSFAITSAYIVINGTAYNVTVPNSRLTSPVSVNSSMSTNSSVLMDLSPVIATIYTNNSTVFVLVPSLKAVLIGNESAHVSVGEKHPLNDKEYNELNATTPAISIDSASLTVVGNTTTELSVTVTNNANASVNISHVVLFGTPKVFVTPWAEASTGSEAGMNIESRPFLNFNSTDNVSGDVSPFGPIGSGLGIGDNTGSGMSDNEQGGNGQGSGVAWGGEQVINGVHVDEVGNAKGFGTFNGTENASASIRGIPMPMFNVSTQTKINSLVKVGVTARSLGLLDFIVEPNGTMVLPSIAVGIECQVRGPEAIMPTCVSPCADCFPQSGYMLQAHSTATFTYTGQITFAGGSLRITPVAGSKYSLVVLGTRGAHASINVTAVGG